MDMFENSDIKKLMNLLYPKDETYSEEDEYSFNASGAKVSNPSTVTQNESKKCAQASPKNDTKHAYSKLELSKEIWSDDEVSDEDSDEAKIKIKPEYEIVYQQNVTADDVYLQLNDKGPGSDSCENLLVKIKLPNTQSKDEITLKVLSKSLTCKTSKYYLDVNFSYCTDPENSSAKWDEKSCTLTVQLPYGEKLHTQSDTF